MRSLRICNSCQLLLPQSDHWCARTVIRSFLEIVEHNEGRTGTRAGKRPRSSQKHVRWRKKRARLQVIRTVF